MTAKDEFTIRKPPAKIRQSQEPVELNALEDYPYKSVALGSTRANLTGLWRYWRPYYQTKRAPCDAACPVGNQVVDYIQTALQGHWSEAANILRSENPLPAITGRICHRPCEMSCNRRQYDERIAIHDIEAVLAEVKHQALCFPANEEPYEIAVVGSGPAELAFAHFMALLQHHVTLFDAAEALGGRLRYGPQGRHLPDGVLDAEIERIIAGRIEVKRQAVTLADLESEYDVIFGVVEASEHLTLHISSRKPQDTNQQRKAPNPALGDGAQQGSTIKTPLRVSEAIGYGKWAALLLDSEWRGLDPADTLSRIQVAGNNRIVSATKYLALLTGVTIQRSEEVVTYERLRPDMMEPEPAATSAQPAHLQQSISSDWIADGDIQHALAEAARCFSCGRCNECDNCWIYCPDGVVSRNGSEYSINYDYCKGCTLCAAVCPRGVISVIEEEKWSG
jgi:Pyruvate/2-oxoacid:ferredoxin oxidoreductase delta subunit